MAHTALVMMAADDNPEGRGRMVHLMTTAADLGTDAEIFFHGAAVNWLAAFDQREHPFTQAYDEKSDAIRDQIVGACNFCTNARFEVGDSADRLGVAILGEEGQHHSIANILASGATVITF